MRLDPGSTHTGMLAVTVMLTVTTGTRNCGRLGAGLEQRERRTHGCEETDAANLAEVRRAPEVVSSFCPTSG